VNTESHRRVLLKERWLAASRSSRISMAGHTFGMAAAGYRLPAKRSVSSITSAGTRGAG
jgi:hypothetical protein